jgi:hypothetical protein
MKLGVRKPRDGRSEEIEQVKAQAEEWVAQTRREFVEARSRLDAEQARADARVTELEHELEAERERRLELEEQLAAARAEAAPVAEADSETGVRPRVRAWAQVKALAAEGHSQREIARRLGLNRRTVARLIAADAPPRYRRRSPGSMLDPLEPVMRSVLREQPEIDAPHMTDLLRGHGYRGSVDLVRRRLQVLRAAAGKPTRRTGRTESSPRRRTG